MVDPRAVKSSFRWLVQREGSLCKGFIKPRRGLLKLVYQVQKAHVRSALGNSPPVVARNSGRVQKMQAFYQNPVVPG